MPPKPTRESQRKAVAEVAQVLRRGQHQEAKAQAIQLLKIYPDAAGLYEIVGHAFVKEKQYENAIAALEAAVRKSPKDQTLRLSLAKVQTQVRRFESAEKNLRKVDPKGPHRGERALCLGDVYVKQGRLDRALTAFQVAQATAKFQLRALSQIARIKREQHKIEEANTLDLKILKIDGMNQRSIGRFLKAPYGSLSAPMIAHLDAFRARTDFRAARASDALFSLARLQFHEGAWTDCAETFRRFNAAKLSELGGTLYDIGRFSRLFEQTRAANLPKVAPRASDPKLLLILGASTSGKSTVEKLLEPSAHTLLRYEAVNSEALKELKATKDHNRTLAQRNAVLRRLFFIREDDPDIRNRAIVGTLPAIIFRMPILLPLIPNLYVVHVQKDPRRLAIDILAKKYTRGNEYAYHPDTATAYVAGYQQQMDILADRLGTRFLRLPQDRLKDDPAGVVAEIEELLGMDLEIETPRHSSEIHLTPDAYYDAMAAAFQLDGR